MADTSGFAILQNAFEKRSDRALSQLELQQKQEFAEKQRLAEESFKAMTLEKEQAFSKEQQKRALAPTWTRIGMEKAEIQRTLDFGKEAGAAAQGFPGAAETPQGQIITSALKFGKIDPSTALANLDPNKIAFQIDAKIASEKDEGRRAELTKIRNKIFNSQNLVNEQQSYMKAREDYYKNLYGDQKTVTINYNPAAAIPIIQNTLKEYGFDHEVEIPRPGDKVGGSKPLAREMMDWADGGIDKDTGKIRSWPELRDALVNNITRELPKVDSNLFRNQAIAMEAARSIVDNYFTKGGQMFTAPIELRTTPGIYLQTIPGEKPKESTEPFMKSLFGKKKEEAPASSVPQSQDDIANFILGK